MTTRYDLRGRVAFVTGAASGLGAATTVELARRGARLVLLDRDADPLRRLARQHWMSSAMSRLRPT